MSIFERVIGCYGSVGLSNMRSRQSWIIDQIKEISSGESILDVGAGQRPYQKFCGHLKYYSQDFGEYDGKGNGLGIQTSEWNNKGLDYICDICEIPVQDNSFDNVMCTEVLEHVPDPVSAFKELHRIVRPGGRIIITAPFNSITHFAPFHFSTGFSSYFFTHWSKVLNIEIGRLESNGNYFEYLAQEVRYSHDVARKYNTVKPSVLERIASRIFLAYLQKNSAASSSSKELGCFGYFYLGQKR